MKHSNTWYALILIASALLLSAANGASAESPSQPNQRTQTQTPAQRHNAIASPTASALNQSATVETTGTGATYIYNQYKQSSPWGDFPTWLEAIATILLVVFAYRQIDFVRASAQAASDNAKAAKDAAIATERYVEMTEQMVEATKQSAKAAETALYVNRPFLLVTRVECTDAKFINGSLNHKFKIHLKNFGVGPADIANYIAYADLFDRPVGFVWEIKEPEMSYVPELGNRLSDSLIGAGEEVSNRIECQSSLDPELYAVLQNGTKTLAINGIITYRGGAPKTYETKFFWWFYVDDAGRPVRFVRALRPDLNSHT
jgi:hypothetical protein